MIQQARWKPQNLRILCAGMLICLLCPERHAMLEGLYNRYGSTLAKASSITKGMFAPLATHQEPPTVYPIRKDPLDPQELLVALKEHNPKLEQITATATEDILGRIKYITHLTVVIHKKGYETILSNLEYLPHITNLRLTIDADHNRVNYLEGFISQFSSIISRFLKAKTIVLENFYLTKLPESLQKLPSLTNLTLKGCSFHLKNAKQNSVDLFDNLIATLLVPPITTLAIINCNTNKSIVGDVKSAQSNVKRTRRKIDTFHLEEGNKNIINRFLLQITQISELKLINNSLTLGLGFLSTPGCLEGIKSITTLYLCREPKLVFIDPGIIEQCILLTRVVLLGINDEIAVPIDFFYSDLYAITDLVIDYHIYNQVDRLFDYFMEHKISISVYTDGKECDPDNLEEFDKNKCMTIECASPLPTDADSLVYNYHRVKVSIYHDTLYLRLPSASQVTQVTFGMMSTSGPDEKSFATIIEVCLTSFSNIGILVMQFQYPTLKYKNVYNALLKAYPTLFLYVLENMFHEAGDVKTPYIVLPTSDVKILAEVRSATGWIKPKTPYYALYIVDNRYFKEWHTQTEDTDFSEYHLNLLPKPFTFTTVGGTVNPLGASKETVAKDVPTVSVGTCMQCAHSLESIENLAAKLKDAQVAEYVDVLNSYTFVVLTCGHHICTRCFHTHQKPGLVTHLYNGFMSVWSCMTSFRATVENQSTQVASTSTITVFCPVANCVHSKSEYYYADEVICQNVTNK